jgi:hypothetical protein
MTQNMSLDCCLLTANCIQFYKCLPILFLVLPLQTCNKLSCYTIPRASKSLGNTKVHHCYCKSPALVRIPPQGFRKTFEFGGGSARAKSRAHGKGP